MCLFHNWSKWYTIDSGFLYNEHLKIKFGYYSIQRRRCHKCNKIQMYKQKAW